MILRGFPNVLTADIPATKSWYLALLDWVVEFDSDWFVHLKAADAPGVELGIIDRNHEVVAPAISLATGDRLMLTLVVDDVDVTHARAIELGCEIVQPPTDLFYGQRRMLVRDPNGTLVDLSSEGEPSQEFLDSLA